MEKQERIVTSRQEVTQSTIDRSQLPAETILSALYLRARADLKEAAKKAGLKQPEDMIVTVMVEGIAEEK